MISFVNAKINIGLQIVRCRKDGYHDLQTLFYPVGIKAGTPGNPEAFCDILEICQVCQDEPFTFATSGRTVACQPEKNLVWRAADAYFRAARPEGFSVSIRLDKHLPDGAGMGGGSADAAFTLMMLDRLARAHDPAAGVDPDKLAGLALGLGADCPFFLLNRPAYAEGVGERLEEVPLDLGGYWLLVVRPDIFISTKEAFSGVIPRPAAFDLRCLKDMPVAEWRGVVGNDFEDSIFPLWPGLAEIKEHLYETGALYASLTGSGSCIYGIYATRAAAEDASLEMRGNPTITRTYLLEM